MAAEEGSEVSPLVSLLSDPAVLVGLGLVAAGTAYYMANRPAPMKPPIPLDNQSIELPGSDRARISHLCKNNQLTHYHFEDAKTLYECFQRGKFVSSSTPQLVSIPSWGVEPGNETAILLHDGPCLGWRPQAKAPYKWITYSQVEERTKAFGSGLSHYGMEPGQETYVGIYSQNNVEWVVTEQSCNYFSRIVVPLYDTLGPEAVSYIINQACVTVVVCSAVKVQLLLKQAESCPSLRLIVKTEGVTEEEREQAKKIGLTLVTMEEVEKCGRENPADLVLPTPDDIATCCYTSGTTGNPKGALITHGNVISNLSACYQQLETTFEASPDDVHISYLPMAHMFERITQALLPFGSFCVKKKKLAMLFMCGARIGFYSGDIKLLINDIQTLKPTIFISVPRLLNRVYDKVLAGASASVVKKFLFERAMASKLSEVRRGIVRQNSIWDWLVFGKVQASMGGRVRFIITGSAPISTKVLDFLRVAFGCNVFEGYGQTEATVGATLTLPGDFGPGHVGPPMPCNIVKLEDVPDMNYFAANGEGEVCFKGPNVFQGYLKDDLKTKEVLDEDGWLHSGDIGTWLPNGALKIIDRKKHIFKLAQGEYVAPEKIETIYARAPLVAQAYVYGDSLKACLVGIVVPDEEVLMPWAKKNGVSGSFADVCANEVVKKMILSEITQLGKDSGLHSFEQVKAIMLYPEGFTVENDLLTPTFKLKRPACRSYFMQDCVQLYSQLPS